MALTAALGCALSPSGGQAAAKAEGYRLSIGGAVDTPVSFSLAELASFPQSSFCPREEEEAGRPQPYQGVQLRELLASARPQEGADAVVFICADGLSARLPLGYVMEGRVLLALERGGQPLKAEEGGPLMAVPDDLVGYKWVDLGWLKKIMLIRTDELNP